MDKLASSFKPPSIRGEGIEPVIMCREEPTDMEKTGD